MNKRTLALIIGGIVAVALVCVVLVGLINGVWPWSSNMDDTYTGMHTSGEEETTGDAQDTTISGTVDPTQTTGQTEGTEGTNPVTGDGTGSSTGNKPQNPTQTGSDPTKPTIGVEIEIPTGTTEPEGPAQSTDPKDPTQSTDPQDPTQSTDPQKPKPGNTISMDSLIEQLINSQR